MIYEFQHYNSTNPQIITSFKGNQKLILGGYRYNIHHVKEGVKTWRCVCAKKLTGARSWCKGRAETWDNDSKGIPKGEHNHQTEHDLAELEYFKSQLIFAAIADPQADLNVLVEEASKFLSAGLNFGNRESMKKSLIVARKSAETGELKLGQQPHRSTLKGVKKSTVRSKNTTAAAVGNKTLGPPQSSGAATVKTTKNHSSTNCSTPAANKSAASSHHSSSSSSNSFLLNSSAGSSSGFGSSGGGDELSSQNWSQLEMAAAGFMADNDAAGAVNGNGTNGSQFGGANLGTSNEQLLAAALFAAAMFGSTQQPPESSGVSTSTKKSAQNGTAISRTLTGAARNQSSSTPTTVAPNTKNSVNVVKKKSARVNGILQRLSNKVAAESSVSPSPPLPTNPPPVKQGEAMEMEEGTGAATEPTRKDGQQQQKMVSVETQTNETAFEEAEKGGGSERKRRHGNGGGEEKEEEEERMDSSVENGFGQKHNANCCQRKIICCCCVDEMDLLATERAEIPAGCKKRARFMAANKVTTAKKEPNNNQNGAEEGIGTAASSPADLELFELERELKLEIADEEEEDENVVD